MAAKQTSKGKKLLSGNRRQRRGQMRLAIERLSERQLMAADLGVSLTSDAAADRYQGMSEPAEVASFGQSSAGHNVDKPDSRADSVNGESSELREQLLEEARETLTDLEIERLHQQGEDFSNMQDPTPGQVPADELLENFDLEYDQIEIPAGADREKFLDDFEQLMAEVGRVGGLDGRNDVFDGIGAESSSQPGQTGVDLFGGLHSGPGSTADEEADDSSAWDWIVEKLGGGNADKPEEQGSGQPGDKLGFATDMTMTASPMVAEGVKSAAQPQSPSVGSGAGKLAGGGAGSLITILTSNTSSPGDKHNELNGWAAFLAAALFGKPPIAGSQSADAETAAVVNGEDPYLPTDEAYNEDRTQDQEQLPDRLRDPSSGWGDEYDVRRWELGTGGGVTDPNPNDDPSVSIDSMPDNDGTDLVANYAEPLIEREITQAPQDNREWYF